jgi:hypothetical protein
MVGFERLTEGFADIVGAGYWSCNIGSRPTFRAKMESGLSVGKAAIKATSVRRVIIALSRERLGVQP